MNNEIAQSNEYKALLNDLRGILEVGKLQVYKAIDNQIVQVKWQLGERIVREEIQNKDRADYGKYIIPKLAEDLNINKREIFRAVKFYRVYTIMTSVMSQLTWTHYETLIQIDDNHKRSFYQNKAIQCSWSVRELKEELKGGLYEKTSPKERELTLSTTLAPVKIDQVFKTHYNFKPLGELDSDFEERELENKIFDNIIPFLLELGSDFALLGRQKPLKMDGQTHYIDIVLYHRAIPCVVLVDLKRGKIDSSDIGQMNKYVEYYRKNLQYAHEQPTIGLVIGRDIGMEEVGYALGGLEDRVFVATYKAKLPTEGRIREIIKKV